MAPSTKKRDRTPPPSDSSDEDDDRRSDMSSSSDDDDRTPPPPSQRKKQKKAAVATARSPAKKAAQKAPKSSSGAGSARSPKIVVRSNIWCLGTQIISKPMPRTQETYDGYVRAFYNKEPFISMSTTQRNGIKDYLMDYGESRGWEFKKMRKRPVASSSSRHRDDED